MINEQLEFQISQYVDGTLSAIDRQHVDQLLVSNADARRALLEHQRLNDLLSQMQQGPLIHWDRLADHISSEILSQDKPGVAGRIGFLATRWRIAATVLLAGSALIVARHALRAHVSPQTAIPAAVSDVSGPQVEVANGSPVEEISVGPSPALAARNSRYGEGVIGQGPSKVIILGQLPKQPADNKLH